MAWSQSSFDRAQAQYDNQTPPEDDEQEDVEKDHCPHCGRDEEHGTECQDGGKR